MTAVLVTGGAGFIGSHLVRALLRAKYDVRVLDSLSPQIHGTYPSRPEWLNEVDFRRGSVSVERDLQSALKGIDIIVHLASETGTGQSMYEIAHYNEVNVGGTAALFDILANDRTHHVNRIVLASSRSVYGEGPYLCETCSPTERVYPGSRLAKHLAAHNWEPICNSCGTALSAVPTREDDEVLPISIYAATKLSQEHLVRVACSSLGIDYAILRLQNVYGEGQSLSNPYTGILSIFSTRLRRGMHLPIFEDGLESRDFVHVQDVVNAFLMAMEVKTSVNRIINVGSGVRTTIIDVAGALCAVFGAQPDIRVTGDYRIGDIRHNWADVSALEATLGCKPQCTLAEGLSRFVRWVQTRPLALDGLDKANAELKARRLMG